eukprot:9349399-Alexandrium_andersonii.AAC.1
MSASLVGSEMCIRDRLRTPGAIAHFRVVEISVPSKLGMGRGKSQLGAGRRLLFVFLRRAPNGPHLIGPTAVCGS